MENMVSTRIGQKDMIYNALSTTKPLTVTTKTDLEKRSTQISKQAETCAKALNGRIQKAEKSFR